MTRKMTRRPSPRPGRGLRQLTIRGFDPELERRVRDLARGEGISLNKAVLRLLRKGAGLGDEHREKPKVVGTSLDQWIGTWTEEEARQMAEAEKFHERIDEEYWK